MISLFVLYPALLAAMCIECFLYGIFFVLSVVSLYLLIKRSRNLNDSRRWTPITTFMAITVLLFLSNTIHCILTAIQTSTLTTPPVQLALVQQSTIAGDAMLMLTAIVNDAVITYRLWIVWSYNKRIVIIPLCTLVGLIVCAILIVRKEMQLLPSFDFSTLGTWSLNSQVYILWCVFTLCTNLYCTTMIAWRIWRINFVIIDHKSSKLTSLLTILIESAAVYTIWVVFFLVTYVTLDELQLFSYQTLSVVAGISFMFINVRVGMGWEQTQAPQTLPTSATSLATAGTPSELYSMPPVAVSIVHEVDNDDSSKKPALLVSSSDTSVRARQH
ncbi:uncharacterized protein FIBRA_05614 [Fibroporia radiculosa]|uniref:Uncharacterized protein n=1 Tax=Fibroporia radiculosa TaxID=599839 RepID=J4IAT7_9APHY|nr:uncharacterized protein FIBRA_05614 [Fibroporia radiculosa]CCM03481.1 predicted protein [Fibroporia radiculosa]